MKLVMTYFDPEVSKMFVERTNEAGEKKLSLASPYSFVSTGEIIARVIDVDTEEDAQKYLDPGHSYYKLVPFFSFKTDSSVYFDERDRSYKAQYYGFAVIDAAKNMRVLPSLQVTKDKCECYFYIFPTKFAKIPKVEDITSELESAKIIMGLSPGEIQTALDPIDPKQKKVSRILVAKSKGPVNGRAEYFLPLIDIEKKAGKEKLDGGIDFREVDSIHEVKKGTPILKRIPRVKAENGYTIYGDKAVASTLPPKGYLCGINIGPSWDDENVFVASVDGCIQQTQRKISVQEIAIIPGDVDYESGNINFSGTVHIKGSVLPGFSVTAGADVIIEGNADDTEITAGGSVTVRQGIAGKGATVVKASGELKAKYILNATVETGGAITVEESIINSKVFSNDRIELIGRNSKIMGGHVVARHVVSVTSLGSNKETTTEIMVGRNLEVEKVLDGIRKEISTAKEELDGVVAKMKNSFGNALFEDPKGFIAVLPSIKKKQCVLLLNELSVKKNEVKELQEKAAKVEEKLVLDEEPFIIVKEKVFPGTVLTIRKEVKKINEEIKNAKFYEDKEDKIIRFSSAV